MSIAAFIQHSYEKMTLDPCELEN